MELMHGCNPAQCAQPQRAQNGINLGSGARSLTTHRNDLAEYLGKTGGFGEPAGSRTQNQQIKSLLLCQLSYGPTAPAFGGPNFELRTSNFEIKTRSLSIRSSTFKVLSSKFPPRSGG